MTKLSYRARLGADATFTMDVPDVRIEQLKKLRGAVRYQNDILPELSYACIDDPATITEKVVNGAQNQFLLMFQKVFEGLVEDNLPFASQWPLPLQKLYEESERSGNLDKFFLRGNEQQPPMVVDTACNGFGMEYVPLFMEWLYNEDTSVRVMLNAAKSQFFIMHLRYAPDDEGRCFMSGASASVLAFYGYSIDDLSLASRTRTVLAAFSPVEFDDEGDLTDEYRALHNPFTQWSLCH